jgi:hypothetical protein
MIYRWLGYLCWTIGDLSIIAWLLIFASIYSARMGIYPQ